MLTFKLAYRNLTGAGLRTWLNVLVLSLSYVIIIWHKGLLDGWDRQARTDMIRWEAGGGQFWQSHYDPYDPLTLTDAHALIPNTYLEYIKKGEMTPLLITQGTIFPGGRIQNILIKGIDPSQQILALPSSELDTASGEIPALIGSSMASGHGIKQGDYITMRWRDANGTFDAGDIKIVGIFQTNVPVVDVGQVWIPLDRLQKMLQIPGEATLLVQREDPSETVEVPGWSYKSQAYLVKDIDNIIKAKTAGGSILWIILLLLAMLAVFDTQVLSIFRRQREIGTYIAMGMTRRQVVGLFTAEGSMYAVMAAVVGALYGIPLLWLQSLYGLAFPVKAEDFGISMAERIFPVYSAGLVAGTILIIMVTTTIVSYWPSRKIARMSPTDALKGKIQ